MRWFDRQIIALFQQLYESLLDIFGMRIGTFRMSFAIAPILCDCAVRIDTVSMVPRIVSCIILLSVLLFLLYDFKTMATENRLQDMNNLKPINVASCLFEAGNLATRIFYLAFFGGSALMHHDIAGLGLMAIVFTRCVKVRERMVREVPSKVSLSAT